MMAYEEIEKIVVDCRAPKRMREEAKAWLDLFDEPRTDNGLRIMRGFAEELIKKTEPLEQKLRLIKPK